MILRMFFKESNRMTLWILGRTHSWGVGKSSWLRRQRQPCPGNAHERRGHLAHRGARDQRPVGGGTESDLLTSAWEAQESVTSVPKSPTGLARTLVKKSSIFSSRS